MTINDEFFKKTQENLRRIKAQDNQYTLKKYNIKEGEAEELPSTQPVKTEPTETQDNVVSLDAFRNKKQVASQPKSTKVEISTEERMKRVAESVQRINDLMSQLEKNNRKPQ